MIVRISNFKEILLEMKSIKGTFCYLFSCVLRNTKNQINKVGYKDKPGTLEYILNVAHNFSVQHSHLWQRTSNNEPKPTPIQVSDPEITHWRSRECTSIIK